MDECPEDYYYVRAENSCYKECPENLKYINSVIKECLAECPT